MRPAIGPQRSFGSRFLLSSTLGFDSLRSGSAAGPWNVGASPVCFSRIAANPAVRSQTHRGLQQVRTQPERDPNHQPACAPRSGAAGRGYDDITRTGRLPPLHPCPGEGPEGEACASGWERRPHQRISSAASAGALASRASRPPPARICVGGSFPGPRWSLLHAA